MLIVICMGFERKIFKKYLFFVNFDKIELGVNMNQENIGKYIKKLRKENNLSQEKIS